MWAAEDEMTEFFFRPDLSNKNPRGVFVLLLPNVGSVGFWKPFFFSIFGKPILMPDPVPTVKKYCSACWSCLVVSLGSVVLILINSYIDPSEQVAEFHFSDSNEILLCKLLLILPLGFSTHVSPHAPAAHITSADCTFLHHTSKKIQKIKVNQWSCFYDNEKDHVVSSLHSLTAWLRCPVFPELNV